MRKRNERRYANQRFSHHERLHKVAQATNIFDFSDLLKFLAEEDGQDVVSFLFADDWIAIDEIMNENNTCTVEVKDV